MIGDIDIRDAPGKGLGVYARRAFTGGEFIFRRRHGRVVRSDELPALGEDDQRHICELDWDRFAILLPPGCYLNHSCEPSAMRSGVRVFAWRGIAAGEEITIDYRLNAFDGGEWGCRCGAPSCTGTVVSSFFSLSAQRQREYLRYAPRFIQREYRLRQRSGG